jgi:hypothetical protein
MLVKHVPVTVDSAEELFEPFSLLHCMKKKHFSRVVVVSMMGR